MRDIIGQASNPHYVLQSRIKMDRALYADDEPSEVDIDHLADTDEPNELIEKYGLENVQTAHYYIHRRRLYKMHILKASDLDDLDLVAFMLIDEEHGLREAQQQANLKNRNE